MRGNPQWHAYNAWGPCDNSSFDLHAYLPPSCPARITPLAGHMEMCQNRGGGDPKNVASLFPENPKLRRHAEPEETDKGPPRHHPGVRAVAFEQILRRRQGLFGLCLLTARDAEAEGDTCARSFPSLRLCWDRPHSSCVPPTCLFLWITVDGRKSTLN